MTTSTNGGSIVEALETLLWNRRSVRVYSELPIGLHSMQRILAAAQGITSDDGKRTAPSAHALYPLELFVVVRRVQGLDPGFYRYSPEDCHLCVVGQAPMDGELLSTMLGDDTWLEDAAAVVVVAARLEEAIRHFAEQQPDGMRGARYVQFEAGACTQNMYLAAAAENLGSVVVMGFDDGCLKEVLTLPEDTDPIALFCIGHPKVG
ncbi:SagB/ThcOx family dehydrogenase [Paraburkholderia sp.]|uniref:SagB/ThcOx family dehydrogenase n=1 Tax=Paraburkholderia sp. TaxID=1926495 RepID=UPI0039E42661